MSDQEAQQDIFNSPIIRFIKSNWVILVFLVGLVVTWTNFKNAQANTEQRLSAQEVKTADLAISAAANSEKILTKLSELQIQISVVQTDQQWLKKNVIAK